ncbi:hypothetical protein AGMMS4957_14940 [Bacteroidia bacterium]|nr:hypothetical protein AGMMS4957_14940 [Bacteroidia bacterium]
MENTTSGGGTYTYAQAVYAHGTTAGLSGATGTFTFQSTPSSPTTQPVFPLNGDALDFIAFYPYDPANTLPLASLNTYPIDITHQIPIGTGNGVRADFMWTKTPSPYSLSSPPSGGAIELNFEHLLVKLVVKITRDVVSLPTTWSGSTAATATIKNAVKEATVDLTAGTVAPSTTSVMDVAMRKETWKTGGGGTVPDTIIFEAILMPQTFDGNPSALDSLIVTVPVGSATRYYKSSLTNLFANFNGTGSALTAFTEKTKYTLIADLKGNMLTNISGIINPWLDGGQGSGVAHEQP